MHYTMPQPPNAREVRIAAFREQIATLEDLTTRDWHACVSQAERERWAERARKVGGDLIDMTCKRATTADMDRRERVLDRSTTLLARVQLEPMANKPVPVANVRAAAERMGESGAVVVALLDYFKTTKETP